MYADSQALKGPFADTLTDKDVATRSFWPTISYFGLPYNLLVLSKVSDARAAELADVFGEVWVAEDADTAVAAGLVYEIDTSILTSVGSFTAPDGTTRFTPGTLTVLKQDRTHKTLTPFGISLMTSDGTRRVYNYGDNAWLYALQAVKTSITVWGIWIGHVYHWHIVTAAMQMTMYNKLPPGHQLWPLLIQQSQSLIDFDFALMTEIWDTISPPTPVNGSKALIPLLDTFAKGRSFFDDDPINELQSRGITQADFTVKNAWDAYPVVGDLLNIWKISEGFVEPVVDVFYTSDDSVKNDTGLQAWLTASRDPLDGNVALSPIETRDELTALLTSLLYRVTVHGAGSLTPTVNPALAFISNFPPCLQSTDIPEPNVKLSPQRPARATAEHGDVRRDDDVLLHVRLHGSVRAGDPEGRRQPRSVLASAGVGAEIERGARDVQGEHPCLRRRIRQGLERGARPDRRLDRRRPAVIREKAVRAVAAEHRDLS